MTQPTVLLIVGEGRSGSTILEEVLSQIDGVKALGEVQFIWKRGYFDDQLCGCGEPIRSCTFWRHIFENLLTRHGGYGASASLAKTQYDSILRFPVALLKHYSNAAKLAHREYFRLIDEIYAQAAYDGDATVIVDSSKSVHYAYFLLKYSKADIKVLHLVRDPRGVTYSRSKIKIRTELIGREEPMPRLGFVKSSIRWLTVNWLVERLIKPSSSFYIRVRYEDFASHPSTELGRALRNIGLMEMSAKIEQLFDGACFVVDRKAHSISGNPVRFTATLRRTIQLDETWRKKMPIYKQKITELITWPLGTKYGYIK